MALVQGNLEDTLTELQIGNSKDCLDRVLDAQRALFHSQIDQLQKIVIAQCKLTGVNPLSQEMAAGALSIKIGKRPRDLLNPKATKYLQSIFSIKDMISKKETREISALCGVTITQVREFFASQRSRVRKLVRLSREKAIKSNANNAVASCSSSDIDHVTSVSRATCDNTDDLKNVDECKQVVANSMQQSNAIQQGNQTSKESADISSLTESMPCSKQEGTIPGIDSDEQNFLENVFNLMRKEETFSGQVKLMEWILLMHNAAVLQWFLTKGGVMILATWLSQAALEEQTTVLLVIFKVLCHLPLHKALPAQMSAILQTVNKLRFYRTPDISNKARVLLSRWSKLFVRSQALKRPVSMNYPSDSHKEIIRKQRISEILSDESWFSKVDLPEDVLALAYEDSENGRKLDSKSALKLLPAPCNDSSKKQGQSVSCPSILLIKLKRTLSFFHHLFIDGIREFSSLVLCSFLCWCGCGQVARAVPAKSSRPMSADDIQKAKMRAIFMQRKYGNTDTPANENHLPKAINQKISFTQANGQLLSRLPKLETDEDNTLAVLATEAPESMQEVLVDSKPSLTYVTLKPSFASHDSKPCLTSQESLSEKLKNGHVRWQTPAVTKMNGLWRVASGENSKETEVQTARIRREKETFYLTADDIPANPKDPWDMELDFDDSLTPEIPTEPPPDADGVDVADGDTSTSPGMDRDSSEGRQPASTSAPVVAGPPPPPPPEPDLELLAALLKNPELVFALTSGQGSNLTNAETVALLDVLKKASGGLPGMLLNGPVATTSQASEPPPTSLPSPTPPSERTRMGWQSGPAPVVKNPQLQQHHLPGIGGIGAVPPPVAIPPNGSASPVPLAGTVVPLRSTPTPLLAEIPHPSPSRLAGAAQLHQPIGSPSLPHNAPPPTTLVQRFHKPDVVLPSTHLPVNAGAAAPLLRQEAFGNLEQTNAHRPAPVAAAVVPSVPPLLPTPPRAQPPLVPEPPVRSPLLPRWSPGGGTKGTMPGPWHGRLNGLLDAPAQNPRYAHDQSHVNNIFAATAGRAHSNELLDRTELEPWSPERGAEGYPSRRGFAEHGRGGEFGRGERPERSRQQHNAAGHRDRHRSGRRWRDRDRRH